MTIQLDSEGNETGVLFELVDLGSQEVLEIGCGDGRLTWRYFDRTARVTAIDPFADSIARAKRTIPKGAADTVELRAVAFEEFARERTSSTFDVVILSWSLC